MISDIKDHRHFWRNLLSITSMLDFGDYVFGWRNKEINHSNKFVKSIFYIEFSIKNVQVLRTLNQLEVVRFGFILI